MLVREGLNFGQIGRIGAVRLGKLLSSEIRLSLAQARIEVFQRSSGADDHAHLDALLRINGSHPADGFSPLAPPRAGTKARRVAWHHLGAPARYTGPSPGPR